MMGPLLLIAASKALLRQTPRPRGEEPLPLRDYPPPRQGTWYTGDTHEHLQNCDGSLSTLAELRAIMESEGLNLASVMVWDAPGNPFTRLVCDVTGSPDPLSLPERQMQFTVETSGLDCSRWGHMIGMGIGAEARIARGSLAEGDCADMPGLGLGCAGGDGTGLLNALAVAPFQAVRGAVTGYAHTAWTLGVYDETGFDWNTELLFSGFTVDARCLDSSQRLSFPDLDGLLLGTSAAGLLDGGAPRTFLPLLGPMDAALGEAQFFETTFLSADSPLPIDPPVNWFGLYYKLLSAGLRVGISGGSDRACPLPGVTEHPQTSVLLHEPFTFGAWTRGLVEGKTTLGVPGLRLELVLNGRTVGGELALEGLEPRATARMRITSAAPLADTLELVIDGEVAATRPVDLPEGGVLELALEDLPFSESTWVAARLASQRAHTAAIYVIVDGRPIADCTAAEYWMTWCDAVARRALEHPELELFGCQEAEALERIERARRVFRTYRDIEGLDPTWGVTRYGRSSGACRGPISMGVDGPVLAGQRYRLTCVNAPPRAEGFLYLSRASAPESPCVAGARRLVDWSEAALVDLVAVRASASGYAELPLDAPPPGDSAVLFAQFVWYNPPGCAGAGCGAGTPMESASDALELLVQ